MKPIEFERGQKSIAESVDRWQARRGWPSSSSAHRSPRWCPTWLVRIRGWTLVLLPGPLGLIPGLSSSTATSSAEAVTSSPHPSPGTLSFLSSLLARSPPALSMPTPSSSTGSSVDPVLRVRGSMLSSFYFILCLDAQKMEEKETELI